MNKMSVSKYLEHVRTNLDRSKSWAKAVDELGSMSPIDIACVWLELSNLKVVSDPLEARIILSQRKMLLRAALSDANKLITVSDCNTTGGPVGNVEETLQRCIHLCEELQNAFSEIDDLRIQVGVDLAGSNRQGSSPSVDNAVGPPVAYRGNRGPNAHSANNSRGNSSAASHETDIVFHSTSPSAFESEQLRELRAVVERCCGEQRAMDAKLDRILAQMQAPGAMEAKLDRILAQMQAPGAMEAKLNGLDAKLADILAQMQAPGALEAKVNGLDAKLADVLAQQQAADAKLADILAQQQAADARLVDVLNRQTAAMAPDVKDEMKDMEAKLMDEIRKVNRHTDALSLQVEQTMNFVGDGIAGMRQAVDAMRKSREDGTSDEAGARAGKPAAGRPGVTPESSRASGGGRRSQESSPERDGGAFRFGTVPHDNMYNADGWHEGMPIPPDARPPAPPLPAAARGRVARSEFDQELTTTTSPPSPSASAS